MASDPNRKIRLQTQALARYRRYPVASFLIALTLVLASTPIEEQFESGEFLEAARFSVVLLFGLLALSGRRRTLVWGIGLALPAMIGNWLHRAHLDLVPAWVFLAVALLFMGYLLVHLLRFIVRATRIDSEVLCAGVAGYMLLGLTWSLGYIVAGEANPGAFFFSVGPETSHVMKGFTAIYFSFITLATVGYGDIVPVTGATRMLAMSEAIVGTLYMAVLVSRLVSMYSSSQSSAAAGEREQH